MDSSICLSASHHLSLSLVLCVCLYVCIPRIFFRLSSPKTHLLLSLKLYLQGCVVYTDVCLISVHSSYLLYLCEPVCVWWMCLTEKKHMY